MDEQQLKNLMRSHGIKPNFTYGQNFLVDDIVLQDIVDAAEVGPEDAVLEIGPGIGNLTRHLCERAGFVLSVDKDPKFGPILHSLKKDFKKNFRFEIADALEFNFQDVFAERMEHGTHNTQHAAGDKRPDATSSMLRVPSYKVVANIPYYITGKIIQMLMTAKYKPTSITILTQKEVAINLAAKAGDLGILAISVQLYGEPKYVQTVLARSFFPAPKVDSAIVRIDLFPEPKYKITDEKKFFKVVKACFSGKRKQIHNTLVNNLHLEKSLALEILSVLKIDPVRRPQELKVEEWVKLVEEIETRSKDKN